VRVSNIYEYVDDVKPRSVQHPDALIIALLYKSMTPIIFNQICFHGIWGSTLSPHECSEAGEQALVAPKPSIYRTVFPNLSYQETQQPLSLSLLGINLRK
jgi:hypothetical protein